MSERMAMSLAFVLGTTGVVLMVPFYTPVTFILGTLCLVGFIVFAAIALLRPSRLDDV